MKSDTLKSYDFILLMLGQVISLFGNGILRFALPLYLFEQTKSAALLGAVGVCALVPMLMVMPLGGVAADRINKRLAMVWLDWITGAWLMVLMLLLERSDTVLLVVVSMLLLYGIGGIYQPVVQASIPAMLSDRLLTKGNGIISSISGLASLLSPLLGGVLFTAYGVMPLLGVCMVCFVVSGVLELAIRIPFEKAQRKEGLLCTVWSDLSESITFVMKKQPALKRMILVVCIMNAMIGALMLIAPTVLIASVLGMSKSWYGLVQALSGLGAILGGILAGGTSGRFGSALLHRGFYTISAALALIAAGAMCKRVPALGLVLIALGCAAVMCLASFLSVYIITEVQTRTPQGLQGKVQSLLMTASISVQPLGQLCYGAAFQIAGGAEAVVIWFAAAGSIVLGAVIGRKMKQKAISIK